MSHLQLAFQHLQFLLMKTFHRAAGERQTETIAPGRQAAGVF